MQYTILHADDDAGIRLFAKESLTKEAKKDGNELILIQAVDGVQAIDRYTQAMMTGERIDLVITDMSMPNANGKKVINDIRKMNNNVPIILFCSDAQYQARELSVEFSEKGTGINDLQGIITKYISPKARILCAEDDVDTREVLGEMFTEKGYHFIGVDNAEKAAPYIPSVHVVISDLNQPDSKGGYELAKEVRGRYDPDKLPFILTSASKLPWALANGKLTRDDCSILGLIPVEKPFDFNVLEEIVKQCVPEHLKPNKTA